MGLMLIWQNYSVEFLDSGSRIRNGDWVGEETLKMQRQKEKLRQECINLAETASTKEESGNEKLMQGCTARKQV